MDLVVDRLAPGHDRAAFSCGVPSLDRYIREQAGQDMRRQLAVCYVLHELGGPAIIGYYTLSAASVEISHLPSEVAKRFGRYRVLPATLVGRLATDLRWRGQGMGELLLLNALRRILRTAHTEVGSVAAIVDALDEAAAAFYERFGFQCFEDDRMRLYLPVQVVAAKIP